MDCDKKCLSDPLLGQHDKAIGYYRQALTSLQKHFDSDHPYVKTVKDNLEAVQVMRVKSLELRSFNDH